MKLEIQSNEAPEAIGPYSQAVVVDGLVFVSGQIPLDRTTGRLVDGGIEQQMAQVLKNMQAILAAAGVGPADVVKTTVYLTDLGSFAAVNALYGKVFDGDIQPARATVQVAALPLGALVEIDAVAKLDQ